jgi:hypothetical protein
MRFISALIIFGKFAVSATVPSFVLVIAHDNAGMNERKRVRRVLWLDFIYLGNVVVLMCCKNTNCFMNNKKME